MNKVKIKKIVFGDGCPKICVPLVGRSKKELQEELKLLKKTKYDLAEWRADFFSHVLNKLEVIETATYIRTNIDKTKPIIFTFRTSKEGGNKNIEYNKDYYVDINKSLIESRITDIIDIELFTGEKEVKYLIKKAKENNIKTIISNHDFNRTPKEKEIILRLKKMQSLGGDLAKIAVMAKTKKDSIALLKATLEVSEKDNSIPIITMAMGEYGIITRLSGEIFGSAMTFGSLKKASAPGQIKAEKLYEVLSLIHSEIKK